MKRARDVDAAADRAEMVLADLEKWAEHCEGKYTEISSLLGDMVTTKEYMEKQWVDLAEQIDFLRVNLEQLSMARSEGEIAVRTALTKGLKDLGNRIDQIKGTFGGRMDELDSRSRAASQILDRHTADFRRIDAWISSQITAFKGHQDVVDARFENVWAAIGKGRKEAVEETAAAVEEPVEREQPKGVERRVLDWMRQEIGRYGIIPTVVKNKLSIGDETNAETDAILAALVGKGYLTQHNKRFYLTDEDGNELYTPTPVTEQEMRQALLSVAPTSKSGMSRSEFGDRTGIERTKVVEVLDKLEAEGELTGWPQGRAYYYKKDK